MSPASPTAFFTLKKEAGYLMVVPHKNKKIGRVFEKSSDERVSFPKPKSTVKREETFNNFAGLVILADDELTMTPRVTFDERWAN
ncbi:MAG: hypothetical protein V1777_02130 [Candidatus Micrarchaeota archaeon]